MMNRQIKNILVSFYIQYSNRSYYKIYSRLYKKIIKLNDIHSYNKSELLKWRNKWAEFGKIFSDNSFIIFSSYIGNLVDIVPLEISSIVIEPLLNNARDTSFYSDKNYFDLILGSDSTPKTLLRKINGFYYDKDYHITSSSVNDILNEFSGNSFIIKPSVNSESGRGIVLFRRRGNLWINSQGIEFDVNNLKSDNFIIQECLIQNDKLSFFNYSSINTIRIATYRSVKDDTIHVLNAVLRIGPKGSDVDNAHSGGVFCGIYPDGTLGNYACDYLGRKYDSFNGVDFAHNTYSIPYYEKVKKLAIQVANKIVSQRIIAHDITVDRDGNAKMIEFNCHSFSCWLYQFTSGVAYGDCTDEIINYCLSHMNDNAVGYANWRLLK